MVEEHQQPTRHGAAHGLQLGARGRCRVALFPAVGLLQGLAVGGAGAAIGAVTGHMKIRDGTGR